MSAAATALAVRPGPWPACHTVAWSTSEAWGDAAGPPALSVPIVSGLANPQFLVEIDAIAVV